MVLADAASHLAGALGQVTCTQFSVAAVLECSSSLALLHLAALLVAVGQQALMRRVSLRCVASTFLKHRCYDFGVFAEVTRRLAAISLSHGLISAKLRVVLSKQRLITPSQASHVSHRLPDLPALIY